MMAGLADHDLRYALANELHARPFPTLAAPCHAVYLAIKQPENASSRDYGPDRAHLTALLDLYGASHPAPGATHWFGALGRHQLKWERHTEFVTYTLLDEGAPRGNFAGDTFDVFPDDWLANAPGVRITSVVVRVEEDPGAEAIPPLLADWFVAESLAASSVLSDSAVIAGDFRIDEKGHVRFAVFRQRGCGSRRLGRIVQRLCEIETYKSMSMLGLARARSLGARMAEMDAALNRMTGEMTGPASQPEETLKALIQVSSELEATGAQTYYRFGATRAYERIVRQRIDVMREERFAGYQTFAEFMMRRYDPAMRTVDSTFERLHDMSARASRAADLLRTRVDVERSAQNQSLLESMDRRADLQLRLQRTVEGLSVVAISYYAVGLALYVLEPLAHRVDVGKPVAAAIVTPVVVLAVWWMVRRIRRRVE
jgi:uncharacterized membrane-anchored protein